MTTTSTGTSRTGRQTQPADDASHLVRGVSPVLEVPFTASGEVDLQGFGRVVQHVLSTGVTSVMFPGFASEYHKLSEGERWDLTQILLAQTREREDITAIVAVQDHATVLAAQRATTMVREGADMINLLPPHFLSPRREAVVQHVRTVLSIVDPVPVVLQYAPTETSTSLDAQTLREIAAEHPNLRLVKVEASPPGPFIAELASGPHALPSVEGYAGVQLPDAVRRGAVGTQPGCSFTEIYLEIWRRLSGGAEASGRELHRRLLPYISYWMLDTERIVATEKLISVRRGLFESAYCREPTHQLDAEDLQTIDRFFSEFADMLPAL